MELTDIQKKFIDRKLEKLSKSKFRSSFKLKQVDFDYFNKCGEDKIIEHAYQFIYDRLAKDVILNDGRQTPMKGHPVFVAQHATATCCRGCLEKWHHIDKGRILTDKEVKFIVALIISWINKQRGIN